MHRIAFLPFIVRTIADKPFVYYAPDSFRAVHCKNYSGYRTPVYTCNNFSGTLFVLFQTYRIGFCAVKFAHAYITTQRLCVRTNAIGIHSFFIRTLRMRKSKNLRGGVEIIGAVKRSPDGYFKCGYTKGTSDTCTSFNKALVIKL